MLKRTRLSWIWMAAALASASSAPACVIRTDDEPDPEPEPEPTMFAELGAPVPFADDDQLAAFERGREVALRRFAPDDGLGPGFNVVACANCHEKPVFGGAAGRYRNFVLAWHEADDAIQTPMGVLGSQAQYDTTLLYSPTSAETTHFAQRNPVPLFGLGLLAEIPEDEILLREDPDDADGDGISGRANIVAGSVGRFGRKAQLSTIEDAVREPLFRHLGVTTEPLSDAARSALAMAPAAPAHMPPFSDDDGIDDPEMSEADLSDLISFTALLAAPMPDALDATSERGAEVFDAIGCASCHTPALEGPRGAVPAYSDLLLHDMGEVLADGVLAEHASGTEFRTQPLWGISVVGPYLHDGRADTLTEAIDYHGGEGQAARDAFASLEESDRDAVIAFLVSLGGQAQFTEGLVPPDYVIPEAGAYGGPVQPLDEAETERFERGLRAFDRDFFLSEGLGEEFNGDSCRSCHFDPVVGGGGPLDVNVLRNAVSRGALIKSANGGSLIHHHLVGDDRPGLDPFANVFEARQTPSVLGLGLVERIPEADIIALEDPDDLDQDGISGRANIREGRLGRLGLKASNPNLAEFARGAFFAELGLTVPDQEGLESGRAEDDDDVADPELDLETLEDLVFFMRMLAPPPRTSTGDAEAEQAGEVLFGQLGCKSCHVDSLTTDSGEPVLAYSDFLLHDIAPAGYMGIPGAGADPREFRTAPLWGLATSAPYMHDGMSHSIEHAIMRHESEAEAARVAYEALDPEARAHVLSFLSSL